jgi:hypothetical protein
MPMVWFLSSCIFIPLIYQWVRCLGSHTPVANDYFVEIKRTREHRQRVGFFLGAVLWPTRVLKILHLLDLKKRSFICFTLQKEMRAESACTLFLLTYMYTCPVDGWWVTREHWIELVVHQWHPLARNGCSVFCRVNSWESYLKGPCI